MCGIAGMVERDSPPREREAIVRRMLGAIRHRGPDQFGLMIDPVVALGNARLSIIDLSGGQQPLANEDGTLWVVFNGEIFNHVELRAELEARGHRFATRSDTEVIVHLYEELGPACLERFNGQFAFALWDTRRRRLFLARDRVGVRPLYYARGDGVFWFGSEIKCLFCDPRISRAMDPAGVGQVFTFWAPQAPRTAFAAVRELPPGHCLEVDERGAGEVRRWWQLGFAERADVEWAGRSERDWLEEFRETLIDAVRIRLRADVPVGAYLSGGLDSSTIASVVRRYTQNRLVTFSIAFDDVSYDESDFQRRMAKALGTEHQVAQATHAEIGRVFPDVIWHAEAPLMRTAPAPMFLLSRLVRSAGYKVVLTGEGADEFLCGYDLFKETKIRRFWARQPQSAWRPSLLRRLYQDIARLSQSGGAYLTAFFKDRLADVDCPWYSHLVRWRNTRRCARFLSPAARAALGETVDAEWRDWEAPAGFDRWGGTEKAQYWEIMTFLSPYLLSSQGDRMGMAHSVEGRFPFLDARMMALAGRLPSRLKLRVLQDKWILREVGREWLPPEIQQRPKRPYRAPIHRSFFGPQRAPYVDELLSGPALAAAGWFEPGAVEQLVRRAATGAGLGETDDMALAGIISTQLLHRQFVEAWRTPAAIGGSDDVKCVRHCLAKED